VASYAFEFKRRINEVPELENYNGAPFTLGKYCVRALRRTAPNLVPWDDVHRRVIGDSIGKHGQDPEDVYDAIVAHSPGAITDEEMARVRTMIDQNGEQLEDRYEAQRAMEDRDYRKQVADNGGAIRFIQGPSEEDIARRVYGDD
jgi:hypothetical protein